ncbi:hypothetical protein IFM89_014867 [Coptis chinensis]|uniref:Uncharacterized protein n=1 Tax=Coptis chinensis TaxID=261450 RepID=A0A835ICX5_9MAGN|nr:hypothetical protein IFM89_014867 [Coptis chinensis]
MFYGQVVLMGQLVYMCNGRNMPPRVFLLLKMGSLLQYPCSAAVFKEVDEPLQFDMSGLCMSDEFIKGDSVVKEIGAVVAAEVVLDKEWVLESEGKVFGVYNTHGKSSCLTQNKRLKDKPIGESRGAGVCMEKCVPVDSSKLQIVHGHSRAVHSCASLTEISPTILSMSFTDSGCIPSLLNLNKIFRRFGHLKESKTDVLRDMSSAKVVFKKSSDAEKTNCISCKNVNRDELAVQIAKKIANVEYGLRSGSLFRNLDANKNKKCRVDILPDILLYLEEAICNCGKWGFVGTAGLTIAESIERLRKNGVCLNEGSLSSEELEVGLLKVLIDQVPYGHGAVNPKGLNYYNNLIDQLVSYGIEPHVTKVHVIIPSLAHEDFTAYANVCFKEFGDRVNTWMTFNEPNIWTIGGNSVGMMPPSRCSYPFGVNCTKGDSTTELYIGAHIILLSHAAAVHLYRTTYQEKQRGQIGITLLGFWFEPMTNSPQDIAAAIKEVVDCRIGVLMPTLMPSRPQQLN